MYRISLPNEKIKAKQIVNFLVALLNALAFGYTIIYSHANNSSEGIGFAVSVSALIFFLIKTFTQYLKQFVLEISFFICALIWWANGEVIPGLLLALFGFLGLVSSKKRVIIFDEVAITLPTFPEKRIPWQEIDFAKLKDGILTIELKNNHLIQHTLEAAVMEEINEQEFNNFCTGKTILGPVVSE